MQLVVSLQRQKQMSHLERELEDAAVEDNKKLRLRLVGVSILIFETSYLTIFSTISSNVPVYCQTFCHIRL